MPTDLIEAGRNFGATGIRFFTRLLFPAIAPGLLNGLRLGMATCLITLIAAEFVGAEYGMGAAIRRASQQFAGGLRRPLVLPWQRRVQPVAVGSAEPRAVRRSAGSRG